MGKKQDASRTAARVRRVDADARNRRPAVSEEGPSMRGGNVRRCTPRRTSARRRRRARCRRRRRWTAGRAGGRCRRSPLPQPSEDAPAQQLQRSDFVVRQLQGNLLHTLIAPALPELAGKVTGMLLEGLSVEEVGAVLSDARIREACPDARRAARCRRRARARAAPRRRCRRRRRGRGIAAAADVAARVVERVLDRANSRRGMIGHATRPPVADARPVLRCHGRRAHALYVDQSKTHTYGTLTRAQSPSRPFSPARPCARR